MLFFFCFCIFWPRVHNFSGLFRLFLAFLLFSTLVLIMRLPRTISIDVGKKLNDKPKNDIVSRVIRAFPGCKVRAVQIVFEAIRVTFTTDADFQKAKSVSGVYLFDLWCKIVGGGPPITIVHIFDYPFESPNDEVTHIMKDYGDVQKVKQQTYLNDNSIYTGTRLVFMTLSGTLPRFITIGGYLCRIWYKGQPLVCNLCAVQGHRSANCPNKDKCRRCGQSGHFARDCPNRGDANQGSTADSAPPVVNSALDLETAVSTPSVAPSDTEAPSSGVFGRMARRFFSRASSTPARGFVVPSTSEFDSESSAVIASPSGEAPSAHLGISGDTSGFSLPSVSQSVLQDAHVVADDVGVASGFSLPPVSQPSVGLDSQSILQDAQVVVTDSMDVEVAGCVPVCDVIPGVSSVINNVISTTENDINVVGLNNPTESNVSNVSNVVNVLNQSNELIEFNVSNVVNESNDLNETIEEIETSATTVSDNVNPLGDSGQEIHPVPVDAESVDGLEESMTSPADVSKLRKEKKDKERRKLLPSLRAKSSSGVSKSRTSGRHVLPVAVSDRPPPRR